MKLPEKLKKIIYGIITIGYLVGLILLFKFFWGISPLFFFILIIVIIIFIRKVLFNPVP
jgi:hypothetical protein